jgi:hypothetical protein
MKAKSHPGVREIVDRLQQAGYSHHAPICTKRISSTADVRIGLGLQPYRDESLDVDVTVGVHFPELETLAKARQLPVAGSVAWTVSCNACQFLPDALKTFAVDEDPAPTAARLVADLERVVLPRLQAFASYRGTIDELDRGFPCLWPQKRMVIPLAYIALGDAATAWRRVREFVPPTPENEAQREYVCFAEHFHRQFCSGVE